MPLAALGCVMLAATAHAWPPLRNPQVPISGTALQSVFQQTGGAGIHPDQDQLDRATIRTYSIYGIYAGIEIDLLAPVLADTFGVYYASQVDPTRISLFPPGAGSGWEAVVGFRRNPLRTIVNVFDGNFNFFDHRTYLGADTTNLGLYLETPSAIYYSEDARNTGHEPRFLLYADPLYYTGFDAMFIAGEDQASGSPTPGDFADVVVYTEVPIIDAVQHSTWAALKQRFR